MRIVQVAYIADTNPDYTYAGGESLNIAPGTESIKIIALGGKNHIALYAWLDEFNDLHFATINIGNDLVID